MLRTGGCGGGAGSAGDGTSEVGGCGVFSVGAVGDVGGVGSDFLQPVHNIGERQIADNSHRAIPAPVGGTGIERVWKAAGSRMEGSFVQQRV